MQDSNLRPTLHVPPFVRRPRPLRGPEFKVDRRAASDAVDRLLQSTDAVALARTAVERDYRVAAPRRSGFLARVEAAVPARTHPRPKVRPRVKGRFDLATPFTER